MRQDGSVVLLDDACHLDMAISDVSDVPTGHSGRFGLVVWCAMQNRSHLSQIAFLVEISEHLWGSKVKQIYFSIARTFMTMLEHIEIILPLDTSRRTD